MTTPDRDAEPSARAAELVRLLGLQPHPEGGHYREIYRAASVVQPKDERPLRSALTTIDFLLARGEFSAWHRVASDEVWHLLEGNGLRLWLMPPGYGPVEMVELGPVAGGRAPRHVVPAHWWQAAEPLGDYALVGATVGPGFDFADFAFLRAHADGVAVLRQQRAELARLL
ncbi:MAG: cupin domain-containing protein [Aquabacterium sp.]|jgi:predicted cupin superfamily sugar epimerase|nr:MAG: cupin domain-containing protein [Aquabacterium sp.]